MKNSNLPLPLRFPAGTPIARQHLLYLENRADQLFYDANRCNLQPWRYGMLPGAVPQWSVSTDEVALLRCSALLPNGHRVEVDEATGPLRFQLQPLRLKNLGADMAFDIWLVAAEGGGEVDYEPVHFPSGENGLPIDHHFGRPRWRLEVVAAGQAVFAPNRMVAGRAHVYPDRTELLKNYVPPCVSIACDPRLTACFEAILAKLKNMKQGARNLLRLASQDGRQVERCAHEFARHVLFFVSDQQDYIEHELCWEAPFKFVNQMRRFGRALELAFEVSGKEELLTYFERRFGALPAEVEQTVSTLTNLEYDHLEIGRAFADCHAALEKMQFLLRFGDMAEAPRLASSGQEPELEPRWSLGKALNSFGF